MAWFCEIIFLFWFDIKSQNCGGQLLDVFIFLMSIVHAPLCCGHSAAWCFSGPFHNQIWYVLPHLFLLKVFFYYFLSLIVAYRSEPLIVSSQRHFEMVMYMYVASCSHVLYHSPRTTKPGGYGPCPSQLLSCRIMGNKLEVFKILCIYTCICIKISS